MKAPLLMTSFIFCCSTIAFAECPEGQVEKAFQDGASVSYQCLEPGAAMIDDSDVQFGGEGEENGSGGAEPQEE